MEEFKHGDKIEVDQSAPGSSEFRAVDLLARILTFESYAGPAWDQKLRIKESNTAWNANYFRLIDNTNQNGEKMKKVMKDIAAKIALDKGISEDEYNLITLAGEALKKKAIENNVLGSSWDIKAQDALQNLTDENGDISAHHYFQLASCNFKEAKQYDWIGEEIEKLTLATAEKASLGDKILFESNNLTIMVNIQSRKLVMLKSIRRGPDRIKVEEKIYIYKYNLDRLSSLGKQLVK